MIRLLQNKDYEDYVELLRQLTDVGEVTQRSFEKFVRTQYPLLLGANMVDSMVQIFVYEIDNTPFLKKNKIIGCVTTILERKLKGNTLHIEDVVSHKDYRGKGIGADLMERCIKFAKDNNCYKIVLDCSDDNVGFYEKSGFKVSGNYMSIRL